MPYKSNIQIMFSVSETHIQPSPEIYCIILCMRDVLTPDDPDLTVIAADCGTWRVYQAHLTAPPPSDRQISRVQLDC